MEYLCSNESDKEYFRTLNKACYLDVVSRQFGPWNEALQENNFEAKWLEQTFKKIAVNGIVVGGIWIEELENSLQLREIQIHPDHQNQGIGTVVVQDAISMAIRAGKPLLLRVLFENKAFHLYKKLGFVETGRNANQYEMSYRL